MSMGDFAEGLTHTKFKLRLVCESCGEPQGEGYSVKQPKEWVTTMLPAMKVRHRCCCCLFIKRMQRRLSQRAAALQTNAVCCITCYGQVYGAAGFI
jgi:hypothetical protein